MVSFFLKITPIDLSQDCNHKIIISNEVMRLSVYGNIAPGRITGKKKLSKKLWVVSVAFLLSPLDFGIEFQNR